MRGTNQEQLTAATDIIAKQLDGLIYLISSLEKDEADPTAMGIATILDNHVDRIGDALDSIHNAINGMKMQLAA